MKSKSGLIYFLIWLFVVASFWLGLGRDAMGYSLLAFYAVLPLSAIICSAIRAIDGCSVWSIIMGSLLTGFAYSAAQYLTFSLANMIMISFTRINPFSIEAVVGGAFTSLVGFLIGGIVRAVRRKT